MPPSDTGSVLLRLYVAGSDPRSGEARRLCQEVVDRCQPQACRLEIVEVDPLLDPSYKTAMNSNYIMHACMTGIAMRRKGIVQEHFLSPLSTEHNQPER